MSDIETIEADALTRAAAAEDLAALDALRVAFLGKTGSISTLLKSLGGMSPDDRRTLGPLINGLRDRTAAAIAARKAELETLALDAELAAGNTPPPAPWIASGQTPPIRIISPGRTYRCDSDATHTPMFHQLEGLVIDRGIHMGHLKWTVDQFIARFFELPSVVTRFRPHHFPFTEPSAEMDVQCDTSGGEVKIGVGAEWSEIVGCGMVHPKVLRSCGIDPDEWQGFAFGFGVDRLARLKYGMPDLRDMFASDTRWLAHYGFSAFQAPNATSGLS
jgi:phenylalanyl-tRNA synthetase alpha subunit